MYHSMTIINKTGERQLSKIHPNTTHLEISVIVLMTCTFCKIEASHNQPKKSKALYSLQMLSKVKEKKTSVINPVEFPIAESGQTL